MEGKTKKHFVLVHGICHGGWCWYKLVTILNLAGHKVKALDLGGCGIHPKKLEEISSMDDYVKPLMDFMASLLDGEKVVLVGHSYAGLCISLAMQNFPQKISVAVFISAYLPDFKEPPVVLIQEYFKRTSMEDVMDCQFTFNQGNGNLPKTVVLGPDYIAKMYKHCAYVDIELAKMLVRPHGFFIEDMKKESLLTKEKYGSVKRVYVVCEDDQVVEEDFQRFMIKYSPPEEVKSIAGAGHMVMLSKAPELYQHLEEIAER
ncbi:hypothetical protein ACH5RR_036417 [Cinchona calisaya]|uniref:AB hydrolase-1 domain-containing protein n=1 Tax=Cinchona calisaya TaxID=153742 RepID=A0ABD2Y4D8_9GENT